VNTAPNPDLLAGLPTFLGFILALLTLAWLSRQLSLQIQTIFVLLTRNIDLTIVLLFLLLLPGIVVHEVAHWVAARLLGLKTGKFRVWPKKQGKYIGLGSVSVQRGNLWQDTIVGMAPLLAGTILLALIGEHIFQLFRFSLALSGRQWEDSWRAFQQTLQAPDGILWTYLLFAIANAMMPSASDREPVKPLLLYSAVALILYFILGLPLTPFATILQWLAPALQTVSSALLFTIVLDSLILGGLFLIVQLIHPRS
jgi:hypothetical protein